MLAVVACAALAVVSVFGNAAMEYFTPFLFGPVWLDVMLGFAAVAIWSLVRLRHIRREGWSAVVPAIVCGVTDATLIALPLPGPHPSDEEMIRDFTQHREGYTALLQRFEADPKLERLGDLAGDWPENPADAGVDSARLARYRTLMRDLGVCCCICQAVGRPVERREAGDEPVDRCAGEDRSACFVLTTDSVRSPSTPNQEDL